jgi:hypothetical protein
MAYQRQYYMLYPNYSNQTSFATNWLEPGEHIDKVVRFDTLNLAYKRMLNEIFCTCGTSYVWVI